MNRFVLLFVLLTLTLTACAANGEDKSRTIPKIATNAELSILVEALTKANLVEALEATGPFTVFAPTDEAFNALFTELNTDKAGLLARADLADILKYHVLNGSVSVESLSDNQELITLQGETIVVAVTETKQVSLNNGRANVTAADVPASNGLIHVIDKVLLPLSLGE